MQLEKGDFLGLKEQFQEIGPPPVGMPGLRAARRPNKAINCAAGMTMAPPVYWGTTGGAISIETRGPDSLRSNRATPRALRGRGDGLHHERPHFINPLHDVRP